MKDAGIKWRQWKSSLTSNFIEKNKDKNPDLLAHPPKTWANCIKGADWDSFVASRLSPEWAAVRADKKRIRAQNKYDHRSGRGGYKKEEEKLRRELGREPTQWDRADMWCNIRRDKQGSSTQEVDHVVQKIVSIILIFVTY